MALETISKKAAQMWKSWEKCMLKRLIEYFQDRDFKIIYLT